MLQMPLPLIWGQSPFVVPGMPSGDPLRWTPEGLTATALDLPNEPVRTYSWYGVRGSQKYPFGKAWTDLYEFEGWNLGDADALFQIGPLRITKMMAISIILAIVVLKFWNKS